MNDIPDNNGSTFKFFWIAPNLKVPADRGKEFF